MTKVPQKAAVGFNKPDDLTQTIIGWLIICPLWIFFIFSLRKLVDLLMHIPIISDLLVAIVLILGWVFLLILFFCGAVAGCIALVLLYLIAVSLFS